MAEDACLLFDFVRHAIQGYRALGWPVELALGLTLPLVSFMAGVLVVVGLPADYFVRMSELPRRGRALRFVFAAGKNVLGVVMFVVGFVMALPLVPGPGALFMLLGLGLVDFPGKRSLERRLLRQPHLLASVNKMRARFRKPPLLT